MASGKEIKNRIKSVKNTKKITKAMELVSASKMKRAVAKTLASRLYASYSWELLTSLAGNLENITHEFFLDGKGNKSLLILITSNRGLCGAYNAQIIRQTLNKLKESKEENFDFITIGKKGDGAMRRIGQNVIATFVLPDVVTLRDILPISKMLTEEFKAGNYKSVYVGYTDYVSALTQKPKIKKLLPISKEELKNELQENIDAQSQNKKDSYQTKEVGYMFEGNVSMLITTIAEKLTQMQIYQMNLESSASEQSARMMAMKNAGDASAEMISDLTLVYNKNRQASITREISEISAGMASVT